MRKISSNDELMTTRQAGEVLGVAVRTVQLWVESGVLPAWRTAGGHRRIARSAVEKLMAERALILANRPATALQGFDGTRERALKLLVVEDDPEQQRLFALQVECWGLPVELTTASNGFEGLLRIGEVHPDMVVTDLRMPGMDGFQMLNALKQPDSGYEDLMVIVVTALDKSDILHLGGLPEGVEVFTKPVPFDAIGAMASRLHRAGAKV